MEEARKIGIVESGRSDGMEFVQGRLNVGEPMPTPVIRKAKEQANHDRIVIIDVSPGTSCPVVESIKGSDFCLLVTEPTPFGLNDLSLMVEVVRKLGIRCGVVLNRIGVGDQGVEKYCIEQDIPILLKIPLDREIARLYSRGISLVEGRPEWRNAFLELFQKVAQSISGSAGGFHTTKLEVSG